MGVGAVGDSGSGGCDGDGRLGERGGWLGEGGGVLGEAGSGEGEGGGGDSEGTTATATAAGRRQPCWAKRAARARAAAVVRAVAARAMALATDGEGGGGDGEAVVGRVSTLQQHNSSGGWSLENCCHIAG